MFCWGHVVVDRRYKTLRNSFQTEAATAHTVASTLQVTRVATAEPFQDSWGRTGQRSISQPNLDQCLLRLSVCRSVAENPKGYAGYEQMMLFYQKVVELVGYFSTIRIVHAYENFADRYCSLQKVKPT